MKRFLACASAIGSMIVLAACSSGNGNSPALGTTVKTTGSLTPMGDGMSGAPLQLTPTTVVYAVRATGSIAQNGQFEIITIKNTATIDMADATTLEEGGGFRLVTRDGATTPANNDNAKYVRPDSYPGPPIPANSTVWSVAVFDITPQERGGTLEYKDGHGFTFRWSIPGSDSGPQVEAMKMLISS
ncbi:hypothetical protein P3T37_004925 [Kitasatospora sp. MAA4]|uniref:hypothetical protein n=1 Tax=Kitasatospora sp. MAA4 TaxID=3035093 RepID=UPI002472F1F2|nr:hypothetical protein [Kitasatospora sp. MAA4]MDH6135509.1 hypothetical protein [Kitasatospora sp. MAA4]